MTATWWSAVFWYEQIAKQLNGCEMIKKPPNIVPLLLTS